MVDFKKKLGKISHVRKSDPIEIYDSLDRRTETGPLRPSQKLILKQWYESHKSDKNLIIKLHTGEGKTLIGLLILQSKLNVKDGPCIYVCPNIYLVEQTVQEAEKFGIPCCKIEEGNVLPDEVINGTKILITHVQKVFNGKSIFGLDNHSVKIKNLVLDDSHACIESIKDSFTIKINKKHELYAKLRNLFEDDLIGQGEGSYLEIKDGDANSLLPIPYWSWIDKKSEVLELISEFKEDTEIMFTWPIIKNNIEHCQAFITGSCLEISPVHIPIHHFGSFHKARQRILMSATTLDDSFFIKGLGFDAKSVQAPLINKKLKWSGEKMLIFPSLIDESLDRDFVITKLAKAIKRKFGIVSIVPDFKKAEQYKNIGAKIVSPKNIFNVIRKLKAKEFNETVVIANRYDGIDLPDESCRILIIDSKPFFISLSDRYEESCRSKGDIINIKMAQKIEQGIGRSVRGEKDYSVIILVGGDLVKFVKSPLTNKYFSPQTKKQIDIGIEIAKDARDELTETTSKWEVVRSLVKQALNRDENWKEYYKEEMDKLGTDARQNSLHKILSLERDAGELYFHGDTEKASEKIQDLCDSLSDDDNEKGWYLQLFARYMYTQSKIESNKIQKSVFQNNMQLLKPKEGINYKKLEFINENRIKRIQEWLKSYKTYEDISISVDGILEDLTFGMPSEKFENALKDVGELLGFLSQRPDKEFKKGPDNLWCGGDNNYFIFECKSEVADDRDEIKKSEAGQMNTHCGWFEQEYKLLSAKRILIIPTKNLSYHANFTHEVTIMKKATLRKLKSNIKSFFREFKNYKVNALSDDKIQKFIDAHELDISSLNSKYSEKYFHKRK